MIPIAIRTWERPRAGERGAIGLLAAMLLLAAAVQALAIPVDADVSWLITVCERVLGGQQLYIDIVEVNPPASVWLYLPMVWLAQATSMKPEAVVIAAALACAALSIRCCVALSRRLPQPPSAVALTAALGFGLLVLPCGLFAQREHLAVMLAAPVLGAIAVVAERRAIPFGPALLSGLAAGLVVVIKPHFALAIVPAAAWAAVRARNLRPLLAPATAAALTVGAYAAAVLLWAPRYLDVLPMLSATYLPQRDRPLNFLIGPLLLVPLALLVVARTLRPGRTDTLASACFLGSFGFAAAGLIQGKNYLNHAFPGMALSFAAIGILLVARRSEPGRLRLAAIATAVLAAMQLWATASIQPPTGLARAIREAGPPAPTVMTLGTELLTGHPAARLAGGRWVGSRAALFTAGGARAEGLGNPARAYWYRQDVDAFASDVRRNRPDLILVEDKPRPWLFAEPAVTSVMRGYRPATRAGTVEVWRRR